MKDICYFCCPNRIGIASRLLCLFISGGINAKPVQLKGIKCLFKHKTDSQSCLGENISDYAFLFVHIQSDIYLVCVVGEACCPVSLKRYRNWGFVIADIRSECVGRSDNISRL